jgi:hypothetical protein
MFTSISAVPLYAGLRRFSEGRDFVQWTGDDSKALMKVLQVLNLFRLNIIMTCFSPRFMSLQLPDMCRQPWSNAYQRLWTSATYFDEMQLPPVL